MELEGSRLIVEVPLGWFLASIVAVILLATIFIAVVIGEFIDHLQEKGPKMYRNTMIRVAKPKRDKNGRYIK